MDKPAIPAFIAAFLALGMAVGERTLQRTGDHIHDLLADNVMGPEASEILEAILAGIDGDEPEPDYTELYKFLTSHAVAA